MTESTFRKVLTQFVHNYWGAFHEALEAQSVTPRRLAGSLFEAVRSEHEAFEAMYVGPEKGAAAELGDIWRDVQSRRYEFADPALTHDDVARALQLFRRIYNSLVHEGQQYAATRQDVLKHAPHGTPNEPLRADAAR
jgi:hypothetical protein